MARLRAVNLERLNNRYGPWFALASGIATLVLFKRGASFAPAAVAAVLFAWTAAIGLSKWLGERPGEHKLRRTLRLVASTLVAGFYQDALFYLLPLWFGSATFTSANLLFPLFLAAMAVFSCFEHLYREWVLEIPLLRTAWTSIVLFATLVAAVPSISQIPLRFSFALAAGIATFAAALALIPIAEIKERRLAAKIGGAALGAALLAALLAPLLPPVPIHVVSSKVGTAIEDKNLVGEADEFPAGTEKVYAWFAVNAPRRYRQPVRFRWLKNGDQVGREFETQITGGREAGFRVWGNVSAPGPGSWTAELYTDSGQLLGRESFEVE